MKVELSVDNHDEKGDSDSSVPLPDLSCISKVFTETMLQLNPELAKYSIVEIAVNLVTEEVMKDLNQEYRNIEESTDVLSFPLWEQDGVFVPPTGWNVLPLGDIVICPSVVEKETSLPDLSYDYNFNVILSHGLLHLIGWDHSTGEEEKKMWEQQRSIAARIEDCVISDKPSCSKDGGE